MLHKGVQGDQQDIISCFCTVMLHKDVLGDRLDIISSFFTVMLHKDVLGDQQDIISVVCTVILNKEGGMVTRHNFKICMYSKYLIQIIHSFFRLSLKSIEQF